MTCISAAVMWVLTFQGVSVPDSHGIMCFTEKFGCEIAKSAANRVFTLYNDFPQRQAVCVEQPGAKR